MSMSGGVGGRMGKWVIVASRAMLAVAVASGIAVATNGAEPEALKIWPEGRAPGDTAKLDEEKDLTKDSDNLIAGKRLQRIGNVSIPTMQVFAAGGKEQWRRGRDLSRRRASHSGLRSGRD